MRTTWAAFAAGLGLLLAGACAKTPAAEHGPVPETQGEAQVLDDFNKRVDAYMKIHNDQAGKAPALSNNATPEQIDRTQREILRLIAIARANAVQGELFTPGMQTLVRKTMARIFKKSEADGKDNRQSVDDENPTGVIPIAVNARYPDEVPMATMPPEVLQSLPKLPTELEYRFVGRHLVILDVPAHLIADYVTNAMPQ